MTSEELEAQEMRRAAGMVEELADRLTAELQAVKPLTREQIAEMARQAHETSPDLQRLDAEIGQLKAIDAVFTRGKQERAQNSDQGRAVKQEARQVQKVQVAQEVLQLDCLQK